jgi:SAM-dependent methyltransferase
MHGENRRAYWDNAYASRGDAGVSWFEDTPAVSLALIRKCASIASSSLIDIGGGSSRLVDILLREGMQEIIVLDLSPTALSLAKARLGAAAKQVEWIAADVTEWTPARTCDVWHDRATFHFLTDPDDRAAYIECLHSAVNPTGHAIIATFAPDGPERCSGLPVMRYDPAALVSAIGSSFRLVDERRHMHTTPWGSSQAFQFSVLERVMS